MRRADGKPKTIFRQGRYAEARERFAEAAADMEMGYYSDADGHQWDARPFVSSEVMRHLGFSDQHAAAGHMPPWWPGNDAMRRIVSLRVMLRQAQARAGAGGHPWLEPLLAASVEELLHRLYVDPQNIGLRELVELTTKLARLQNDQRRSGALSAPGAAALGDGVAYQKVTETIMALPPEEQERARRTMEIVSARMLGTVAEVTS